jgi:diguanylate cyclase (GGDEF)-like protein/PAS domain S-box-containing protein
VQPANSDKASVDSWGTAAALSLEGERAQITLDSIGDAVVSTDLGGRITYLNRVAESMTGWSRQEAAGRPLEEVLRIVEGTSRESALNPLRMAILHKKPVGLGANSVLIDRHGREFAIEDNAAPIRDRSGRLAGAVMVFHDVSAARALSLRMSHLAHHDVLTGLPNRLLLNERLSQTIASARRHRKSLAVMFLDVDGFKSVNDSLGHAVGDRLLQSIARRLVACVRGSDTVSRQGGDEFVVLLAEMSDPQDAVCVADKIVADSKLPHPIGSHCLPATASIGIGVYPADGTDAETLLENADLALLRAKAQGRGSYQFFRS